MTIREEIQIIKDRWKEDNRYRMIEYQAFELFDKAQKDMEYLLRSLETANKRVSELEDTMRKYQIIRGLSK